MIIFAALHASLSQIAVLLALSSFCPLPDHKMEDALSLQFLMKIFQNINPFPVTLDLIALNGQHINVKE